MSGIKHKPFQLRTAFTIVEVLVVITVITIIMGIGATSATKYQENARDSERESKANIIANGLEKYYTANNEYPSCSLVTAAPSAVRSNTLKALLDENVLTAPRAADGTNSIRCTAAAPDGIQDTFNYSCTSATISCAKWELKYRNDSDGQVKTIASIQKGTSAGDGSIQVTAPTVSVAATLSGANATGTSTASCSGGGTVDRQIRFFTNSNPFNAWLTGASTTVAINEGESATFQAQARCTFTNASPSAYTQSNNASVSRPVTAPTGLVSSAAVSGAYVTATVSGGSCATGVTLQRQIQSNHQDWAWGGAWTGFADIAGTSQTLFINEGWRMEFQQQARCINLTTGVASGWVQDSVVSAIRPIDQRGAPAVYAAGDLGKITYTWSGAVCPVGTSKEYQWYRTNNAGNDFGWWGVGGAESEVWSDNSQGYTFTLYVQQRCNSNFTSGPWSGNGVASYYRGVSTPGGPYNWVVEFSGMGGINFAWTAPSCGPGTQGLWRADYVNGGGAGISWLNSPTGRASYWFYGGANINGAYANPSTSWSSGWPSYGWLGDSDNIYAINAAGSGNPPRMSLDWNTVNSFDSGDYIGMAVQYKCRNPTTGAESAPGQWNSRAHQY